MSFPLSSGAQPTAASAAPEAPMTLRNSRRLTPVFSLMSVVAVGAVVPRALALGGIDWCCGGLTGGGWLRRVAGRLQPFLGAVAVHVTAHAPAHVERGELVDTIHLLDLAV